MYELLYSLIGVVVGGVITAIYNEYSTRKQIRNSIYLKVYDEIIDQFSNTSHKLSRTITFLQTGLDTSNKSEFIKTLLSKEILIHNYFALMYDFADSSNNLINVMEKHQLIFVKYGNYVKELNENINKAMSIMTNIRNMILNGEVDTFESSVFELCEQLAIYKKITWNFAIDLENNFSKIMKMHINKNKPGRVKRSSQFQDSEK